MYLLVWSPQAWQLVNRERLKEQAFEWAGQTLSEKWQQLWHKEIKQIDDFVAVCRVCNACSLTCRLT